MRQLQIRGHAACSRPPSPLPPRRLQHSCARAELLRQRHKRGNSHPSPLPIDKPGRRPTPTPPQLRHHHPNISQKATSAPDPPRQRDSPTHYSERPRSPSYATTKPAGQRHHSTQSCRCCYSACRRCSIPAAGESHHDHEKTGCPIAGGPWHP